MIAALQKSRSAAPAAPAPGGAPRPQMPEPAAPEAGPGDAMLEKLASIEAKLDKICAAMNMNVPAGDEPAGKEEKEAAPDDHGY
jgi:hypothetical protein